MSVHSQLYPMVMDYRQSKDDLETNDTFHIYEESEELYLWVRVPTF